MQLHSIRLFKHANLNVAIDDASLSSTICIVQKLTPMQVSPTSSHIHRQLQKRLSPPSKKNKTERVNQKRNVPLHQCANVSLALPLRRELRRGGLHT